MNIEKKDKLYGEILSNLKEEMNLLTVKIKQTRENHDFGTYKNLILAFKEVLGIYKNLLDDENIPITYNIHVNSIKCNDAADFINQLKSKIRE